MLFIVDRAPERAECWRQILRRQNLFARAVALSALPAAQTASGETARAEAVLLCTHRFSAFDAEIVRHCFGMVPLCPVAGGTSLSSCDGEPELRDGVYGCPDTPTAVAEALASLARRGGRDVRILRAGPLRDDMHEKAPFWGDRPLSLSPTQRLVLRLLLWVRGEGCAAEEVKYFCLKTGGCCTDGNVPAHISQINRRLAPFFGGKAVLFSSGSYVLASSLLNC